MAFYDLVLLVHIAAVIVWLGSGFLMNVLALQAERAGDPQRLGRLVADMDGVSKIFPPAALVVLLAGVVMVIDGPWQFGQLWVLLALAGFAATFVMGMLVMEPAGKRVTAAMEREGQMTPSAALEARRLFAFARIDFVVLVVILMDMVLKPSADDVAALGLMGVVLVGGTAFFLSQARAIPQAAEESRPAVPV